MAGRGGWDFVPDETQQAVARLAAEVMDRPRPAAPAPATPGPVEGTRPGGPAVPGPARLAGRGRAGRDGHRRAADRGRAPRGRGARAGHAELGVLPVVRRGDRDQQRRCWPASRRRHAVDRGSTRTVRGHAATPATTAALAVTQAPPGRCRSGIKVGVPWAAEADWILVRPGSPRAAPASRRVVRGRGVTLEPAPKPAGGPSTRSGWTRRRSPRGAAPDCPALWLISTSSRWPGRAAWPTAPWPGRSA